MYCAPAMGCIDANSARVAACAMTPVDTETISLVACIDPSPVSCLTCKHPDIVKEKRRRPAVEKSIIHGDADADPRIEIRG